ncbi:MAG: DUF2007 domain-containing protein [Lachnospiraceae bacterium]|nr:DUF2007 domain-containing protein [Lachnospiraceae bacterium]
MKAKSMMNRITEDDDLIKVANVSDMVEAELLKGYLECEGIPCFVKDAYTPGQYLRVLGWGSPFGTDVFVSRDNADQARTIIEEYSAANELTEEELTEMAHNCKDI